jgi:hypothetical protein
MALQKILETMLPSEAITIQHEITH